MSWALRLEPIAAARPALPIQVLLHSYLVLAASDGPMPACPAFWVLARTSVGGSSGARDEELCQGETKYPGFDDTDAQSELIRACGNYLFNKHGNRCSKYLYLYLSKNHARYIKVGDINFHKHITSKDTITTTPGPRNPNLKPSNPDRMAEHLGSQLSQQSRPIILRQLLALLSVPCLPCPITSTQWLSGLT